MASKRNHGQRKRRAQQNSQNQAHVLAHIADVVPVRVTFRVGGIRLLRRDCHEHKPRDRPAKRRNPRNLSQPLKPARHAAPVMAGFYLAFADCCDRNCRLLRAVNTLKTTKAGRL